MLSLTPAQLERRTRLRRAVAGLVLGLFAFSAFAGGIYVVKSRATAGSSAESAKAATVAPKPSEPATATAQADAPQPLDASQERAPSEAERALALARTPVVTTASFKNWSELAHQLSPSDRKLAEHELSRLTVTGERPVQEAARLELALLWRATDRRAKAHKVLVSLARSAADPLVKKYALDTLTTA
jgi:hypothetical protein